MIGRHIIIDGSDNLGKTTVITQLSEKLNLPVIKMPNMKDYIELGLTEEFSRLFNETVIQFQKYDFIMDRGYTSSVVYSKVFDRCTDLSYIKDIESALEPIVVILTGRKNIGGHVSYVSFSKDPIYNENQKRKVDKAFCELAEEKGYPLVEVAGKTSAQITDEILQYV